MPESKNVQSNRRQRWTLTTIVLLFAFGAGLRLLPVLLTPDLGIGLDDMFQYDMLARSLAAGDGFRWYASPDLQRFMNTVRQFTNQNLDQLASVSDPRGVLTSFRAPLYPALLSLVYRLVDPAHRLFAARIFQSIITATIGPLTYCLARELAVKERFAIAAGLLLASWPLLVSLPLALATENLFLPLTAAGTLLLLRYERRGSDWLIIAAGLTFALAALTRSVIIGFPGLVAMRAWLQGRRRQAVLLLLPLLLLITPWVLRNSLLHGRLTLIETSLGYNLYLGYHPDNTGTFKFGPSLDLIGILDDHERDQFGRQLAWEFIRQDPGRLPQLMLWKMGHFWGLEDRAFSYLYSNSLLGRWPPILVLGALAATSLPLIISLPLAIAGWSLSERDRQWQLLTLLMAWYIGVHLLIMAEERFHFALLPMLAALAARGLSQWPDSRQKIRSGHPDARRRLLLAVLLIGLAFFNWGLEINRNSERYQQLMQADGWHSHLNY